MKIFVVLLTLSVIMEGSLTTIPLSFVILLILLLITSQKLVFYLAFIIGILLDLFNLRPVGLSSIYFLLVFFAILAYERKFEIKTSSFVLISSFFGSLGFLSLTGVNNAIIFQSIVASLIALILFKYHARSTLLKA